MDQQQIAGPVPAVVDTAAVAAPGAAVELARFARAFEAWENGFRANPTKFLTAEECAAAEVSELSASRAAYFSELLAQFGSAAATNDAQQAPIIFGALITGPWIRQQDDGPLRAAFYEALAGMPDWVIKVMAQRACEFLSIASPWRFMADPREATRADVAFDVAGLRRAAEVVFAGGPPADDGVSPTAGEGAAAAT